MTLHRQNMKFLHVATLFLALYSATSLAQTPSIPPGPPVLVLGGEYHLATCTQIGGQVAKTVPLANAMRDGANPCNVCRPNSSDRSIGAFAAEHAIAIGR